MSACVGGADTTARSRCHFSLRGLLPRPRQIEAWGAAYPARGSASAWGRASPTQGLASSLGTTPRSRGEALTTRCGGVRGPPPTLSPPIINLNTTRLTPSHIFKQVNCNK
ncbi:UNVERIFIED_CONTAM: hypothetical protein Slati_2961900 [Sesamum latifolium]|uniref:Uncharacterized protein n=1 Tax=Sesamum latifolium TaxID=2727402 RepID=A0AAW2VJG2_9LAMI